GGDGTFAGECRLEDAAPVRALRAVRDSEEVADRGQHGARGHPRLAGHLPCRARRPSALRGSAARRLHRGALRGGGSMSRATALLSLSLASSACAVGPRYQPPQVPVPPGWSEARGGGTPDEQALGRWWAEFRDPILDRLVARAVEGNLDLKIASA